jgi:FKBP-type peptidyl-prolyl cis-trans isomerase SlyD
MEVCLLTSQLWKGCSQMKAQVVSFRCVLKTKFGRIISSTFNQDVVTAVPLDGGQHVLSGLAEGLQNLKKGDRRSIFVPAQRAYGFYEPSKVITQRRDDFPTDQGLKIGSEVELVSKTGARDIFRVTEILDDVITLDGNHPLAGQDLVFEIEATEARDAMPEDVGEASAFAAERPSEAAQLLH